MKFFIYTILLAVATASTGNSRIMRAAIGSEDGWLIDFMRTKTTAADFYMLYRGAKALKYITGPKCGDCKELAKHLR